VPYYGCDRDGTRSGFPAAFLDRVRRAEYPQYLLDKLPVGGAHHSVLRLDHVLAVGSAPGNFELTRFRLTREALEVVRDWFQWLVEGDIPADSLLELIRDELMKIEAIT